MKRLMKIKYPRKRDFIKAGIDYICNFMIINYHHNNRRSLANTIEGIRKNAYQDIKVYSKTLGKVSRKYQNIFIYLFGERTFKRAVRCYRSYLEYVLENGL